MKDTSKTKGELIAELKDLREELREHMDAESDAAKAEEAMWETQIALLALFNNLPGMAYRTAFTENAPKGRVEFVSGGCLELTGYPASKFVSDPTFYREKIVHPDDRENVRKVIGEAQEDHSSYEMTYRIIARDGDVRWLNEHGTGLYDGTGDIIAREGFITDISESVAQLDEIRRQHAQLQKLTRAVEQAHELIMIGDRNGIVQYVNKAFEDVTGYSREEMVGNLPSVAVPDSGKTAFFRRVLRQLQAGKPWRGRYVSTCKDGSLFEVEATVSPIFSDDGDFDGYVAQQRDTTHEVRSTPEDRNAQRLEVLGIVAGSFIRDLNNQLQGIIGYGRLAAEAPALEETCANHLRKALEAADRAREINSEFLEFLRHNHDEQAVLSLTNHCDKAVKLLRASLPVNIAVGGQLSDDDLHVTGVSTELLQAIVALGVTAARPLRACGGTLNLRLERLDPNERATQSVQGTAGTAAIRVIARKAETDCYVPPSSLDENGNVKTGSPGGTSFTLAVIRDIIMEHGGDMDVEEQEGQEGLRQYVVLLPLTDQRLTGESQGEKPEHEQSSYREAAGLHLMFVDDEHMLAELAKLELEELDYKVSTFTSATEALEAFEATPDAFDLVIADQTMPQMTGFDLARHMLHVRSDLPIILITGYSDVVNDLQARAIGIRDYLIKPITPETLAEAVANALG